jgi:DNA-binding CsgD family transcriptional regulator
MFRAVSQFVKAAPTYRDPLEVLDALNAVADEAGLHVLNSCLIDTNAEWQRLNRTMFYHPAFPGEELWAEYQPMAIDRGGSLTVDYLRTQSSPVTLGEITRALRLTDGERWPVVLLRKFHIRDCLHCPFRPWALTFYSERGTIQVDGLDRQLLAWAASTAVEQMDRLVKPRRSDQLLTLHEMTALRHRAHGRDNHQLAKEMRVSVATVRTYLAQAIEKLGANDMAHAVWIATRAGLLNR